MQIPTPKFMPQINFAIVGLGFGAEEMHACHGSTFAVESCHIKFKDSDLSAQLHRSLFDVARQYRESFEV